MGERFKHLGGLLALALSAVPASACTVFLIARDGVVLAGNNEDYMDPDTKIWFVPGKKAKFGRVYFGFSNWWPQGGMNEKGLFFDGLALERVEDEPPEERSPFGGNAIDTAMRSCATVEEVVAFFEEHDMGFGNAQLLFGDATGDAVIVERGVMHRKQGDFQVATNFRLSRSTPEEAGCARYAAATGVLAGAEKVDLDLVREALDSSKQSITLYSNAYDLVNLKVHIWLDHDFTERIEIDLMSELENGRQKHDLPEFFEKRLLRQETQGL